MPRQYANSTGSGGHNAFTQEQSLTFWERHWRTAYLAPMMPSVRAETIERAHRIAAERPHSYLAAHLRRLYGGES